MAKNETYHVIRDGELKVRIPGTIAADGTFQGPNGEPLIDGVLVDRDGADLEEIKGHLKARRFDKIPDAYKAREGKSDTGLEVISARDWQARQDRERSEQLFGRRLDWSRQNKPCITCDVRDSLAEGDTVEFMGCFWLVEGVGKDFDLDPWTVHRAYVDYRGIANGREADAAMREAKSHEEERHRYAFDRMMADGDNDGANPPRGVPKLIRQILDEAQEADPDGVARDFLRRRCVAQAESDPSTTSGYIRRRAGERALQAFDAGDSNQEVLAALESYKDDPEYLNHILGM